MAAQHRFVRPFAHHRSIPLRLNRPAPLVIAAAAAVLTCLTGTARGKGANIRRSEPIPLSRAGTPTPPSATVFLGGCGRGRYRDPSTRKCRGPADFGN
jgi:hypothetical protein